MLVMLIMYCTVRIPNVNSPPKPVSCCCKAVEGKTNSFESRNALSLRCLMTNETQQRRPMKNQRVSLHTLWQFHQRRSVLLVMSTPDPFYNYLYGNTNSQCLLHILNHLSRRHLCHHPSWSHGWPALRSIAPPELFFKAMYQGTETSYKLSLCIGQMYSD